MDVYATITGFGDGPEMGGIYLYRYESDLNYWGKRERDGRQRERVRSRSVYPF